MKTTHDLARELLGMEEEEICLDRLGELILDKQEGEEE